MLKLKHKFGYLAAYLTWALYTFNTPVMASNAVSDIMNNERFQGAIDSIEWLTVRVDYWFTVIISATSFFIISAALMKNAFAAAYCANHKFWDAVDEAHQKSAAWNIEGLKGFFTNKQFMQMSAGSVKDALLGIIPNIKAFTDFDEDDIEPKRYFMKAIPQMLVCVIIGVFIYNGYYRDTAAMVGEFGSEICRRTFSSVDPVQFVNKLTQTTSTPDNVFANDQTLEGKDAYEISMALYKAWLNESKDLTEKEHKASLMRDCENTALALIRGQENHAQIYDDGIRQYDYDITGLKVDISTESSVPASTTRTSKDDYKTYSARMFADKPSACEAYVKDDLKACITFVYNGHDKDTEQVGMSSIKTAPGSWNQSSSVVLKDALTVGSNYYEVKGGEVRVTKDVTSQLPLTSLKTQLEEPSGEFAKFLSDSKYDDWSITGFTVNNYDTGGGQNPKIRLSKGSVLPATRTLSVRVRFKATKAGNTTYGNYSVNVTWKITMDK